MVLTMKKCKNCNMEVKSQHNKCPLCLCELQDIGNVVSERTYPKIKTDVNKYTKWINITKILSIIASVILIIINFLTTKGSAWSLISIAGILFFWGVISHALRTNSNVASKLFVQVILISILVFIIDNVTGYKMWSLNYVIPSIIVSANMTIFILILINRMNLTNYIRYQILLIVFGFILLILYLFKLSNILWTSLTSAIISFVILILTLIYSDKSVSDELKRRLHF